MAGWGSRSKLRSQGHSVLDFSLSPIEEEGKDGQAQILKTE
jgi:hypothetical protein